MMWDWGRWGRTFICLVCWTLSLALRQSSRHWHLNHSKHQKVKDYTRHLSIVGLEKFLLFKILENEELTNHMLGFIQVNHKIQLLVKFLRWKNLQLFVRNSQKTNCIFDQPRISAWQQARSSTLRSSPRLTEYWDHSSLSHHCNCN